MLNRAAAPPFATTCRQSLVDPFASFSSISLLYELLYFDQKLEVAKKIPRMISPFTPNPV